MTPSIKRGASFSVPVVFTAEKWAALYPWSSIAAAVGQGSRRTTLAVAVDAPARTVTLSATAAQTALWVSPAPAALDLWVTRGASKLPVPAGENIGFTVVDGVTQ